MVFCLTLSLNVCLGYVAGSIIQGSGRTKFEDGSRIGNQSEARNSIKRVCTIPEINGTGILISDCLVSKRGFSLEISQVLIQCNVL